MAIAQALPTGHDFLPPGSETGRLIASANWASTSLGPIDTWPQSLRTALGLVLHSPVPMVLLWGEDGSMLYNDAYSGFAGGRHPKLLGSKVREGWPEVADFNDNVMRVGLAGGTLAYRDQELTLYREGAPERVWMNLDYSPVHDETGRPAGVLAVVVETTERVVAERHQAFRLSLAEDLRDLADPDAIMAAAARALGEHLSVARVGYGEVDEGGQFVAVEREWTAGGVPGLAGRYRLDDYGANLMADMRAGRAARVDDVASDARVGEAADAHAALGLRASLTVPLVKEGRLAALLYANQPHPRHWTDEEEALAREVAERTWAALARARAEAALRENEARQAFLLALGDRLRGLDDPQEVKTVAAEMLGRQLRVARAGYGEIDASGEVIRVERDWSRGVPSLVGEVRLLDGFGSAIAAELRAGRTLRVDECLADSRATGAGVAETWASIDLRAVIAVPLLREERFIAFLYLHEPRPRTWTDREVMLAQEAAERTWAAVERARAEAALRRSEERQRLLLELGDLSRGLADPEAVVAAASRVLGEHLGATRVAFAEIDDAEDRAVVYGQWTSGPTTARLQNEVRLSDFGRALIDRLRSGVTLRVDDVSADPDARDSLPALDAIAARAIVSVPLFKGGCFVVNLNVHQDRPRAWADAEIELIEAVARRTWEAFERARAEATLRDSEARLAAVLEGVSDGFYAIDPRWRFTVFNAAAERHFGMARGNVLGRLVWELFPQVLSSPFEANLRAVMAGADAKTVEAPSPARPDRVVELRISRMPEGGGIAVAFSDVTERVRAEVALRASEEELRLITDALPVLVSYVDRDARYCFNNRAYEEWFGHAREEVAGRHMRDVLGAAAFERLRPHVEAALAGETVTFESRVPYKDGGARHIEASYIPRRRADGAPDGFYVLVLDVTERRTAEERLSESEARFRNMADHAPVMMWVTDSDGACTYLNRGWYEFTGQSEADALGFGWLDAIHPDDKPEAERVFREANDGRRPFRLEYRLRGGDDRYRWAIDAAAPRFGPDGAFLGYIGSVIDIDERRGMETALRESEERLRLAAKAAQIGTWDLDIHTGAGHWDEAALRIGGLGDDPGRYDAASWLRLVHADDRERVEAAFRTSLAPGGAAYDVEFRGAMAAEDGGTRWITSHGAVIRDPETGRVTRAVGIIRDATTRHRQQERLRESEERLRTTTNAVPAFVWFATPDGHLHYFNDRWFEYTGQTEAAALPDGWAAALHPEDVERTAATWADARERGVTYEIEVRYRRRDGAYRWYVARAEPQRDASGLVTSWFGTSTDIHDRKLAEARLKDLNDTLERRVADRTADLAESQRRFRGIFDSALQFMALLTPAGTVVEVNQTALNWSRIRPEDIVGKPFWLAAPMRGNPELQAAIKASIERAAAGDTVREEHEMRGAGEVRAIVDFSLKLVPDERGEAVWLVAEGRDITELKQAQEALRQAQKLEAVGQLTGGVAHDFNNLLTIIKSSTDLLRRPGLQDERRRRYVDAISDTVDRASKLTGQLLAFARRQALKPEVFDAGHRVRSIQEMLRTLVGSRVQVAIDLSEEPAFVEADASQFETALVNMAVNARDAMNGEGTLTVRVSPARAVPSIRGRRDGPGRFVAVSLADSGCGIPQDRLSQIFEPFYTTKEVGKGTGLGLSQVYGFAKQSGGDVAVESEVGRGATFTLYLPEAEEANAAESATDAKPAPALEDGRGRRVLVVEDNQEVGSFLTQVLQDLGYDTTWAANAEEALKVLAEANGFDAVFSDVVMPGMSGIELGQEIRRRYPGLPVVLTSGYSHVLAEEGRHGFDLIQKPYAAEELSRVLRRVARGPSGARS